MVHLQVGEGGGAPWAPVDDPLSAVDEALIVQVDERGTHGEAGTFVEGEAAASPVAGRSESLVLLVYCVAVSPYPVPHALEEALAAKLLPREAGLILGVFRGFLRQAALHHDLGGNAGVVGAGEPERGLSLHAVPPDHDVREGGLERVAEVKLPRHVGRRHYDHERLLLGVDCGREVAAVDPGAVEALLNCARIVGFGYVSCRVI